MSDVPTEDNDFDLELAEAFASTEEVKPSAPDEEGSKAGDENPSQPEAEDDAKQPGQPAAPKPEEVKPEEPREPEQPKPLTKDDITEIIRDLRNSERDSTQELETATNEVLESYYPDGLSNVLVDKNSGKELKTPQDVVDASGGEMSAEEAAQWLMNEQYKLDHSIAEIKDNARAVAETTLKFKQDSVEVLTKYAKLFEAYPSVQTKVWDQYVKLVEADKERGVVLKAPDMLDFYDTVLEPYRMAFEYSQDTPATSPAQPAQPVPTPGADDRMDENGDGGLSDTDDPNDFAQQVNKELAKGF